MRMNLPKPGKDIEFMADGSSLITLIITVIYRYTISVHHLPKYLLAQKIRIKKKVQKQVTKKRNRKKTTAFLKGKNQLILKLK